MDKYNQSVLMEYVPCTLCVAHSYSVHAVGDVLTITCKFERGGAYQLITGRSRKKNCLVLNGVCYEVSKCLNFLVQAFFHIFG